MAVKDIQPFFEKDDAEGLQKYLEDNGFWGNSKEFQEKFLPNFISILKKLRPEKRDVEQPEKCLEIIITAIAQHPEASLSVESYQKEIQNRITDRPKVALALAEILLKAYRGSPIFSQSEHDETITVGFERMVRQFRKSKSVLPNLLDMTLKILGKEKIQQLLPKMEENVSKRAALISTLTTDQVNAVREANSFFARIIAYFKEAIEKMPAEEIAPAQTVRPPLPPIEEWVPEGGRYKEILQKLFKAEIPEMAAAETGKELADEAAHPSATQYREKKTAPQPAVGKKQLEELAFCLEARDTLVQLLNYFYAETEFLSNQLNSFLKKLGDKKEAVKIAETRLSDLRKKKENGIVSEDLNDPYTVEERIGAWKEDLNTSQEKLLSLINGLGVKPDSKNLISEIEKKVSNLKKASFSFQNGIRLSYIKELRQPKEINFTLPQNISRLEEMRQEYAKLPPILDMMSKGFPILETRLSNAVKNLPAGAGSEIKTTASKLSAVIKNLSRHLDGSSKALDAIINLSPFSSGENYGVHQRRRPSREAGDHVEPR